MYDTSHQPDTMRSLYPNLPNEIKELFEYGTVEKVIDDLALEFALNSEEKLALLMEVELVLYLLLPHSDFGERLKESLPSAPEKVKEIATKVENDLFIIVDGILTLSEEYYSNELDLESAATSKTTESTPEKTDTTNTVPVQTPANPSVIQVPDPATPEPPPPAKPAEENPANVVKPLRTFAMDANISRAHSYGSFQSGDSDEENEDEPVHRSSQDDIIKK